jgi:hypothetical protein
MALTLTEIPPNGITPPLFRGEPFGFQIGPTKPVISLVGKSVHVDVDNRDTKTRAATIPDNEIIRSGDGNSASFTKAPPWSANNLIPGNYRILVVVDGKVWGTYFMLVGDSEGGSV